MLPYVTQSINWLRTRLERAPVRPPDPASASPPLLDPCPLIHPQAPLPAWIADDPLVQKYQALLGVLPWDQFPERPTDRAWPGPAPVPRAPFVAAFLIQLHEARPTMGALRRFLLEHPALVAWLGFPRVADPQAPHGFVVARTVPTRRQCSRVLRTLSNDALQFLLTATVQLLQATLLTDQQAAFGDTIAGDTQAILAWVKENNPKQFIKEGRLDKNRQPVGDPDCKLGVKKARNTAPAEPAADDADAPATPTTEARPANRLQVGVEIFWGYASGVVATRLPDHTEVVLAERTRPFNESDVAYFHPLMAQVEARLGRRPRIGAWDAAYDAHYVYDYFDQAGGFAAVPFNPGGKPRGKRTFAPDGAPVCAAGLPMTLQFTYAHRSDLIPHMREKWRCPLLHPEATGAACPTADDHFLKGGCTSTIAAGRGSRIRHERDRDSDDYHAAYNQRTVVERINSQAEALGILRPKLRRGRAIANMNTLRYVLINLRALARLQAAAAAPLAA